MFVCLQFELYEMDRISSQSGDVIGVTNDADVGPVAVSYSTGPARVYRRPFSHTGRAGEMAGEPQVGQEYEFTVVPFALEFSLNADIGIETLVYMLS